MLERGGLGFGLFLQLGFRFRFRFNNTFLLGGQVVDDFKNVVDGGRLCRHDGRRVDNGRLAGGMQLALELSDLAL